MPVNKMKCMVIRYNITNRVKFCQEKEIKKLKNGPFFKYLNIEGLKSF